ncbi:MAG: hypothetical protein ACE5F5_11820 [Acidimicrobiia bacterium]
MSNTHHLQWGTQPGSGRKTEYDAGAFYIRSTNKHNHSSTMRLGGLSEQIGADVLKLPPELLAQMNDLVSNPTLPYRNLQDLLRDAIYHRVYQLSERLMDHDFINVFTMELLKQRIAQQKFEDQERQATIDFLDAEIEAYADPRDPNPDGIADILSHAYDTVVPRRHQKQWQAAIHRWEDRLRRLTDDN